MVCSASSSRLVKEVALCFFMSCIQRICGIHVDVNLLYLFLITYSSSDLPTPALSSIHMRLLCAVLIVCTRLRVQECCDPGGLASSHPIHLGHPVEHPAIWPTAAHPDDHSVRHMYKHLHSTDMEGPVL